LHETLERLAQQLNLDANELREYAAEDHIGGFHFDLTQRTWEVGSIWEVEGKVLYALTRVLRPRLIVELGTRFGCSTAHFASALTLNGGEGRIIIVDIGQGQARDVEQSGFSERIEFVQASAADYVETDMPEGVDLLFEDSDHGTDTTRRVWLAGAVKLNPGGLLLSHDADHWLVGADIRKGIAFSGISCQIYRSEPSDCGFAIWQKPVPVNPDQRDLIAKVEELKQHYADLEATAEDGLLADDNEPQPAPVFSLTYEDMTKNELWAELKDRGIIEDEIVRQDGKPGAARKEDLIVKLRRDDQSI
jgi:predicted O-methyltransferase YrrM